MSHSSIMLVVAVLAVLYAATTMTHAATRDDIILWRIGEADGADAEFALGPGGWPRYHERFEQDPIFVVGESEARAVWPYIHPGPEDAWAGSRSHTFTIFFGLTGAPAGDCRLVIDLVSTHSNSPPVIQLRINDHTREYRLPPGRILEACDDPSKGTPHRFEFSVPGVALHAGTNRIGITSLSGAWMLYDAIRFEAPSGTKLAKVALAPTDRTMVQWIRPRPAVVMRHGRKRQLLVMGCRQLGHVGEAVVRISDTPPQRIELRPDQQVAELTIPLVEKPTTLRCTVEVEGQVAATLETAVRPVRPWRVYLLHHTHLDIGYTNTQEQVMRLQWRHLEKAIELARESADYPEGARFKWLPEGLWAVDGYLRQASPQQKRTFLKAVRAGWVNLSALYGNALTGLYHPEELMELTGFARRFSRETGVTIDSAMISDVPGWTWGLVPVLAKSGVKYLSMGPNSGHRIGQTFAWADQPFYWESPSGQDRVLCWVHGKGYSWFHTGLEAALTGKVGPNVLTSQRILGYLRDLEEADYPYDMIPIRYNIGSDNGPPDVGLADRVREWNERYVYPKMVISTPSQAFSEFEARYGDRLPVVRGDYTPYWEDGAASTARETGINRRAADRLVRADALWAMLQPGPYPAERFHDTWRELILYDEHTWGAWNSISDPDNEFVHEQWAWKRKRALNAQAQSRELAKQAVADYQAEAETVKAVDVLNTCNWVRTDLVTLPASMKLAGETVHDAQGRVVPSQRLADGRLAFVAKNVASYGAARFTMTADDATSTGDAIATKTTIANGLISLRTDPESGAIVELRAEDDSHNLVDTRSAYAMNEYVYVAGRSPDTPLRVTGPVHATVVEHGPVVATLRIDSDAPGCESLSRELRVVSGLDYVLLRDTLDRKVVRTPEGVHIAFPFNVPQGTVRVETPWAIIRPELDQMKGGCRNWFTVYRFVDVSNDRLGATWVSLDAPMVEVGGIRADATRVGWLEHLEPSQTLYSYVMNNYWETNYKADQPGKTTFEYAIRPHGGYDGGAASRFALERSQPLMALPVDADAPPIRSLLTLSNPDILVTMLKRSDDDRGWIVRLFNPCDAPKATQLRWMGRQGIHPTLYRSNLFEDRLTPTDDILHLAKFEVVTLRLEQVGGP